MSFQRGIGRLGQDELEPLRPTIRSIIGSNGNALLNALFWGAILVAVIAYQIRQGDYLQATGAILIVGLIAYGVVVIFRTALNGTELPAKRRVDRWLPPRSPAVTVLLSICVATTLLGWMLPHHWYVAQGTVGSTEVWQHHEWWRLATSAFLHANLTHLYMNMLSLWYLGREIDGQLVYCLTNWLNNYARFCRRSYRLLRSK